uniref:hypothetical protein n=1 Tax=Ningiella ruwaisensis TaxID=2364274 RepID=UPI00109FA216|nr:hypothetical protein [Ningiella ruwaisensis]
MFVREWADIALLGLNVVVCYFDYLHLRESLLLRQRIVIVNYEESSSLTTKNRHRGEGHDLHETQQI